MDDIEFMKYIEEKFKNLTNFPDRRHYSIFYSRLTKSPILILGINPGGNTDGSHQYASARFYENWEHEIVDMNYKLAEIMRSALMTALAISDKNDLRKIPKSNTFFHRSPVIDAFNRHQITSNLTTCAPLLAEMILFVQPRAIVLEGMAARDNLVATQCEGVHTADAETVTGLRRGRMSRFFQKDIAFLKPLGRNVTLLTLGHPSHFGNLSTWPQAVKALHRNLGKDFLQQAPFP